MPSLSLLDDRDAFEFLDRALYLDDDRSIDQVMADATRFSKFNFLTNGGNPLTEPNRSFTVAATIYACCTPTTVMAFIQL